jgi:muramoyltetrapeptide carboxypeptidase
MITPPRLKPGDTIMFVSPSGPAEQEPTLRCKERLEARGYHVKFRDDVFAAWGYLAGSDERRAEEMMQAFLDPEVDAVFTTRGGYGVMRMLAGLDFAAIRQHPKLLIGYSDITALHAALQRRSGLVSWHGPGPASGLGGEDGPTDFTEKYFLRAVEGPAGDYAIELSGGMPPVDAYGHGKARGRLVGGNLSMISAIEGTPYAIDCQDAILLVEDVNEAPYRIDRMLRQLKLAGKLAQIRGAVVGQFTKVYENERQDPDEAYEFTAGGVLRQYFADAGVPVLMNFPIGHTGDNCTLPLGGQVEIDADAGTLRVLEGE